MCGTHLADMVVFVLLLPFREQLSSLLLNTTELHGPSSLGAARLAELSPLLPLLGLPFLEGLNATELLAALPALSSVSFSPAQVSQTTLAIIINSFGK